MVYDPRQDPKYANDKLFLALLNRESRFRHDAVSPTGAVGYAQILPSTARDPGFGLKADPSVLTNPERNVAFGKGYLDAMIRRYKGDTAAGLVAYNAGPKAADRWVANNKNDAVIPAEARKYYKNILSDAGQGVPKVKSVVEKPDYQPQFTTKMKEAAGEKPITVKPVEDTDKVKPNGADTGETTTTEKETPERAQSGTASTSSDSDYTPDSGTVPTLESFDKPDKLSLTPYSISAPKLRITPLAAVLDNPMDR